MKKSILFLFLFAVGFIVNDACAQITTYVTSNIPTTKRPDGATIPADTLLDGYTVYSLPFSISLDAVTYDNVTETTAWTALLNATKTEIDSNWIEAVWGLDPADDIIGRVLVESIVRRFDNFEPNDYQMQYTAATDIFRIVGRFEWAIAIP